MGIVNVAGADLGLTLEERPPSPTWEHYTVDGVFMKQMPLPKRGDGITQHAHAHDHGTLVALGAVRVYVEEEILGDFSAPACIHISAGKKHSIVAIEDGSLCYCVHNVMRSGEVEVTDAVG